MTAMMIKMTNYDNDDCCVDDDDDDNDDDNDDDDDDDDDDDNNNDVGRDMKIVQFILHYTLYNVRKVSMRHTYLNNNIDRWIDS
jgi:hypothetical protein